MLTVTPEEGAGAADCPVGGAEGDEEERGSGTAPASIMHLAIRSRRFAVLRHHASSSSSFMSSTDFLTSEEEEVDRLWFARLACEPSFVSFVFLLRLFRF